MNGRRDEMTRKKELENADELLSEYTKLPQESQYYWKSGLSPSPIVWVGKHEANK